MSHLRSRLLVIAGVVIMVGAAIFVVFYGHKTATTGGSSNSTSNSSASDNTSSQGQAAHGLVLDNAQMLQGFTKYGPGSAEKLLYKTIQQNVQNPADTYHATIRQNSIREGEANNMLSTTFLVDIPEIQQTYEVEVDASDSGDYNAVYINCPTPEELVYPAFNCKVTAQ